MSGAVLRLPSVPEGEDTHHVRFRLVTVEREVGTFAEGDEQFAQARVGEVGTSVRRFFGKTFQCCDDDGFGTFYGSWGSPLAQILLSTLHPGAGGRGDDQVWHSGGSCSWSVPHVLIHAMASSPVMCKPVS